MELFFKTYGEGHPLIILHGLLGTSDNWATLARKFGEHYTVFTPDLRNHGRSPHTGEMGYAAMSGDLRAFAESQWLYKSYIMGHSMGGKLAMTFALENPDLVDKLIVVDIGVKAYDGGHGALFEALMSVDLSSVSRRSDAEELLHGRIREETTLQFLLKNLVYDKESERYQWKMNLPVLYERYDEIVSGVSGASPYEKPALFIHGSESGYIREGDKDGIRAYFPAAVFKEIEGAGHWVHADRPVELFNTVVEFLENE